MIVSRSIPLGNVDEFVEVAAVERAERVDSDDTGAVGRPCARPFRGSPEE